MVSQPCWGAQRALLAGPPILAEARQDEPGPRHGRAIVPHSPRVTSHRGIPTRHSLGGSARDLPSRRWS